ncbi:MAG: hypothetical protein JWL76_435 [Thermoleophilia bacterium]|nr:hypothetical protein [Thermoleophilia bacterium]
MTTIVPATMPIADAPPAAPAAGASMGGASMGAVSLIAEPGIDSAPASSIAELHARLAQRSAAIRDALLGGELVQDGVLAASGITGPPQKLRVIADGVSEIGAIGKSASGNYPLAEQFANDFAERLGIGHLVAPVVERDGRVVIAMVPGVQAREAGVKSADDLEAALRTFYTSRLTGVSADEIASRARIDRQLIQVFDHALAIADRHGRNLLVDADQGAVTLIDHSEMLLGHRAKQPLAPIMMRRFMGGTHSFRPNPVVRLDDDVRAMLRQRVPTGTIETMVDDLRRSSGAAFTKDSAGRLVDGAKVSSIGARLDSAVATGALRSHYMPIPEFLAEQGGNLLDDSAFLRRIFGFFRR